MTPIPMQPMNLSTFLILRPCGRRTDKYDEMQLKFASEEGKFLHAMNGVLIASPLGPRHNISTMSRLNNLIDEDADAAKILIPAMQSYVFFERVSPTSEVIASVRTELDTIFQAANAKREALIEITNTILSQGPLNEEIRWWIPLLENDASLDSAIETLQKVTRLLVRHE